MNIHDSKNASNANLSTECIVDILSTVFSKEFQSHEFQHNYTLQRQIDTAVTFAEVLKTVQKKEDKNV